MIKIALFASGNGSNVQRISEYFKNSNEIQIELVLCNNSKAGVLNRCKDLKLMTLFYRKQQINLLIYDGQRFNLFCIKNS